MEAALDTIKALASNANGEARRALLKALRDTADAIETDDDTLSRIWNSHLYVATIRVGHDLDLFKLLVDSSAPITVDQLASITKSDPTLLARLLRYLASCGIVRETSQDEFAANKITKTLSTPGARGCAIHNFDSLGPAFQEMPAYLKKNHYKAPTDASHTVFQDAWNTHETAFEWVMGRPENFEAFNTYMASRRENQVSWIAVYPVREDATNLSADRPLFVDIGGGIGHQAIEFHTKYPDLPGKVVLQDLPFSIEHALPSDDIDKQAIDFFVEQPVMNAKFYYLRFVLHDWPDEKCRVILTHIKKAMGKDSIILVDEMVTPNQGVAWQSAQFDLAMMCCFASMERTEAQWEALFDSVGLKIQRRLVYTPGVNESITALVLK